MHLKKIKKKEGKIKQLLDTRKLKRENCLAVSNEKSVIILLQQTFKNV